MSGLPVKEAPFFLCCLLSFAAEGSSDHDQSGQDKKVGEEVKQNEAQRAGSEQDAIQFQVNSIHDEGFNI